MAVSLRIIRLTMAIDNGDHRAWEQLKALARTDEEARRVLRTVKEPPKPASKPPVKVAPPPKADTPEQTERKAREGDAAAIAQLRKRAEYEDIRAQSALGLALMKSDPDEARRWLLRSSKLPESAEALRRLAASGDAGAKAWVDSQSGQGPTSKPRPRPGADPQVPVRDDLGYIKPPTRHSKPRIGDVYRLNGRVLGTDRSENMVLIKEMRGEYVTAWTVTREPGRRKAALLMDPSLAGFASAKVYVLTDSERVLRKDSLAEYRGSLGPRDIAQFRLSH